MSHQLFRETSVDERALAALREQVRVLRAELVREEQALGELRGQIASFEGRYLQQVGILLKQLDGWQRKIAELHAEHAHLAEDLGDATLPEEQADAGVVPQRMTSPNLRALFRELARRVHPDFAEDAEDEQARTRMMAYANDAFRRGDAATLQRMLDGFAEDVSATRSVQAELADAKKQRSLLEEDLRMVAEELAALRQSDTAQLQRDVIAAAQGGRDLLADLANRVRGAISLAMRQYELDLTRIRKPAKGPRVEELLSAETATAFRDDPKAFRYDPKVRRWMK